MKPNKLIQGILGLLAIALLVFIFTKTRNAYEEFNYIGKAVRDRDTFTVQGEGKITARPDVARIDLGIQTDGQTVKVAQTENTKKMNEIISAIKTFGINEKDIQTSNYNLTPKIDYTSGRQNIIGYTVSQSVTIKVRALDTAGDVLAKAGELGANQINGLQFTIDDPKLLQEQARDKAIDDARKKAQILADKLGLHLIKVVTFSESAAYPVPMPMMYGMAKDMGRGVEASAPSPSVESGSLDVLSDVSVTYEVR